MDSIRRENVICKAAGVALLVQFFAAASVLAAAETPSPALLVLNKEDNTLAIVDPATGKVAGLVPTGESPHEVTVSSDGKFAFVGNYGAQTPGKTISVIDLAAQKEVRRVDLGPLRRPHGVFFADGKLYFTAQVNKVIGRYAPESNLMDWLLGTGQDTTHMVMVAKTETESSHRISDPIASRLWNAPRDPSNGKRPLFLLAKGRRASICLRMKKSSGRQIRAMVVFPSSISQRRKSCKRLTFTRSARTG